MFVLDTNTLIYYFKGMGNVAEHLLSKTPDQIAIPAIVLYELQVGIAKSNAPQQRLKQLQEMIYIINVLPFGEKEALASANIRAELENAGTPIGPHDVLIAGTTVANQGVLVTHNMNEFQRVRNLTIEDWF